MSVKISSPNTIVKWKAINCTVGGATTVIAAVASKKLRIKAINFTCSSAVTIEFRSDANVKIEAMYFDVYGGDESYRFEPAPYSGADFMETNSGEAFIMYLSGASNVRGHVNYQEI